ncbi:unnamed protein product [Zymoseptoria tritici ST99CH_3D1]|uniref:FHA domain-containing protein n=1 Tax=Zymoseptoria tritici ST99CH_1E4 TaxID=1276532 RepID=A0A2H1G5A5_ZYMTR|nr:unnamed protein product [Zymoseptoria tritici ST99CH_1E4]SMR49933.1 unnamed protein product [Zymoseptoria tritici ST99CH_3D1]
MENMCDPVVYLVPASQAAETAFKHRANRVLRQLARKFDDLSHLGLSHRQSVARLDRAFFSGRRNIAFGSCRAVEFRLCHAAVDSYHLLLRVDPESSQLILQDVSGSGTWIRRSKHHDWTKIHQCSCTEPNQNRLLDFRPTNSPQAGGATSKKLKPQPQSSRYGHFDLWFRRYYSKET